MRLQAEFAAAAISKLYEDAIKEDEEQYLGSDDPDNDDATYNYWPEPKRQSQELNPQETLLKEKQLSSPRLLNVELKQSTDLATKQLKNAVNPKAPEFTLPTTPLQEWIVNSSGGTVNPDTAEGETSTAAKANCKPPAELWEKMELRMTQPPPAITPFDGDPAWYLRFRANFRDQVETRASLTDSEKMNF